MPQTLSRTRLAELLNAASAQRLAVIGDAMLDVYLAGDVDRVSPEAPVPVVRVRQRRFALGGAANVAQNVGAIGAQCLLVGAIGNDAGGATLRTMLDAIAVDDDHLVSVDRPTTTKTRVVARSQQLLRVDEEDDADLSADEVARMLEAVHAALADADALLLEDYNKGVLVPEVITQAIAWARQREIPIVVDPKYRNFFSYKGATVFKPNRSELEAALGAAINLDDADALPGVFARLGVEHLLLTLGERGMALLASDGLVTRIPTMAREVYDVVGAGDTVTAYLGATLAAGATAAEAAVIANYAAGIEVGKLGAATVSPDEVLASYDAHVERQDREARRV